MNYRWRLFEFLEIRVIFVVIREVDFYPSIIRFTQFLCTMRKLFTFIVTALLISAGMAMAAPASDNNDGKKTEQNTEKKSEKKEEKKSEKKDDSKSADKPHKPIDLIYEFGWPWIMR